MQRTPASQSQEGRLFALQQERDRLERNRQLGVGGYDRPGFTDQFTAPINDELAWLAGYGSQGVGNIARNLTGRPVEVSALDRARAMREISNEGQDQFVEDYPVQAFTGGVLGGVAMAPARGAAIPGLIGRLGTEAGLGAAYGAAEGDSLSDRLSGAGFGAGVGLALGGAAEVAAPYVGRMVNRFRGRGGSEALDVPALTGQTEAEAALARYRAVYPEDTGARVLNPGDEGYPTNALYDEASQAYVALTPTHQGAYDISVGGRPAGSVSMAPNGRPFVDRIQIDPAFQRQGVGGQVYDQLEETLGVPLVPSPLGLSDEAQGFWRKRLGALDPAQAQTRINEAMDYGQEFGVDAFDRLNPLRPQAVEPSAPQRAPRPERVPSLRPAMKGTDGKIYTADDNHFTAMASMPEDVRRRVGLNDSYRGFVDDRGRYLNRARAQEYALNFGLLRDDAPDWARNNNELVSEYLRPYEPPAPIAPVEPDYPIRAFHGSPHSFDRFSLDKIGTGEGAQAYGHGLYFAENEGVARGYRDALQQQALSLGGDIVADNPRIARLAKAYPSADSAMQGARDQLARAESALAASTDDLDRMVAEADINEARAAIADLEPYAGQWFDLTPTGSMYEVGINADPETFLDWDKPLSEQPAIAERLNNVVRLTQRERETLPLRNVLEMIGSPQEQISRLPAAGINGIRYLDASSRYNPATLPDNMIANEARQWLDAAGGDSAEAIRQFNASNPIERFAGPERDDIRKVIEAAARRPTSNYVVFNDELVKILRKYGISGLGLGLGANALGEQMNEAEPNALNGSEDQYQGTALNPL